ncbi:hypothetical protein [Streptococcus halichoeri]|uniref:hypothetical protein n=1 Tax=Streptococcus halichoeri TaxID=254785 RepID=UPI001359D560|nr:hypothetical protein [Streptococcus halichoeri]
MSHLKLLPYRKVWLFLPLVLLLLVYHDAVFHQLFFDLKAQDLPTAEGLVVKQHYFRNMLSINNSLFNFNFFQAFIFPVIICFAAYSYHFIKTRYLKYSIGKQEHYHIKRFFLKLQLAYQVLAVFSLVFAFICLIAYSVNRSPIPALEMIFNASSSLRFFATDTKRFLIFYFLVKGSALFFETIFACYLVDYLGHITKAMLAFLLIIWALAPLLYPLVPFYLVPMSNLMILSYGNLTFIQIVLTYLPFIGLFIFGRIFGNDEVV